MSKRTEIDIVRALGGAGDDIQVANLDSIVTAATDIIAAPGAGKRIRLFYVLISGVGPAAGVTAVTLSDSVNTLGIYRIGTDASANIPLDFGFRGIPLPENEELERSIATSPVSLSITAVYKIEEAN